MRFALGRFKCLDILSVTIAYNSVFAKDGALSAYAGSYTLRS